jgi:hypothetical protein
MHVSSVSSVFFCMLQVLYLDISKLDRVLHMRCAWEAEGGASSPRAGHVWTALTPAWTGVTLVRSSGVRAAQAHVWTHETDGETHFSRGRPDAGVRPDIRALAVPNRFWVPSPKTVGSHKDGLRS